MTDLDWLCRPIAHRGLHDSKRGIIENSPTAIEAALGSNYAIEIDLQPECDNRPMVFHDASLGRLTAETGPLKALPAKALEKIKYEGSEDRILLFDALLEMVSGTVPLIIEIKSDWTGRQLDFVNSVGAALKTYQGLAAVMSFDPKIMTAFADNFPAIPRGLVAERFRDKGYWTMLSWRRRFLHRHLLLSGSVKPGFIAYDIGGLPSLAPVAARNIFSLKLLTWTVRTQKERQRAAKWTDAMIFEGFRP